jgi:hypothetical protein
MRLAALANPAKRRQPLYRVAAKVARHSLVRTETHPTTFGRRGSPDFGEAAAYASPLKILAISRTHKELV